MTVLIISNSFYCWDSNLDFETGFTSDQDLYARFCYKFNKLEDFDSFKKFEKNFDFIKRKKDEIKKKKLPFNVDINSFTDMTWDEFSKDFLMKKSFDEDFKEFEYNKDFPKVYSHDFFSLIKKDFNSFKKFEKDHSKHKDWSFGPFSSKKS